MFDDEPVPAPVQPKKEARKPQSYDGFDFDKLAMNYEELKKVES